MNSTSEPSHDKTNKMTYAPSEDWSAWASIQSDQSLRCPHEEALGPWLPIECQAKTLIRLRSCAGWSESSLGTQVILLVLSCCGSFLTYCAWKCDSCPLGNWMHQHNHMSHVTRKPVFGVCHQGRFKPGSTAAETSWRLEILNIETRDIILSKQGITKAPIRLPGCAGWSAPLLFAYGITGFLMRWTITLSWWGRHE